MIYFGFLDKHQLLHLESIMVGLRNVGLFSSEPS